MNFWDNLHNVNCFGYYESFGCQNKLSKWDDLDVVENITKRFNLNMVSDFIDIQNFPKNWEKHTAPISPLEFYFIKKTFFY